MDFSKATEALNKKSTSTVGVFASKLFNSRTQAHIYHLQTTSFAAHKALNDYYDGIIGLVDSLIEEYQGKYSIVRGYTTSELTEDTDYVKYFESLRTFVNTDRNVSFKSTDSNLQNTIDEIVSLLDSTIYKLKFLK
jgi:hypothetical protein